MGDKKTSKQLLQEFTAKTYDEIREAKENGELIGWSTSNFPKEICQTFDLKIMYPENHSAAVPAKKGAIPFCEKAEGLGYSMDLCSYARINLGFVEREEDFGFGLDVPAPDFLCVSNNICTTVIKWYENLSHNLDIPFLLLDIPYNTDGYYTANKTSYIKAQLQYIIDEFERITGKKFDYEKFHEILRISSINGALFTKALDLIGKNKPSPVSGFDGYNFMALMVVAKGRPETTEILKAYIAELEERLATGNYAFEGEEKYRLMYDGLACWPYLRHNSETLASMGVNTVGSIYCNIFGTSFNDLDEYCQGYASTNNSQGIDLALQRRRAMIDEYHCDGTLCSVTRSCKPWVGITFEISRQLEKEKGIPFATFDGDQADPRVFSKAQYETRVQGLTEVMDERIAQRE